MTSKEKIAEMEKTIKLEYDVLAKAYGSPYRITKIQLIDNNLKKMWLEGYKEAIADVRALIEKKITKEYNNDLVYFQKGKVIIDGKYWKELLEELGK